MDGKVTSWSLGLLVALSGCATTIAVTPLDYVVTDQPDRLGLSISYTNRSKRTMCLSLEIWPNGSGYFDGPEDRIFIRVRERRFSMKPHNTGYCFGGCPTRVAHGQTVRDFIPYERFDMPADQSAEPKQLEFSKPPTGYACRPE